MSPGATGPSRGSWPRPRAPVPRQAHREGRTVRLDGLAILDSRSAGPTFSRMTPPSPTATRPSSPTSRITRCWPFRATTQARSCMASSPTTSRRCAPATAQWNGWLHGEGPHARDLPPRAPRRPLPADAARGDRRAPIAKRLRMFVLRSKVKIEDASARLAQPRHRGHRMPRRSSPLTGAPRPSRCARSNATARSSCASMPSASSCSPRRTRRAAVREKFASTQAAGVEAWEAAAIRAGVPTVVAATQEAFVPQMVNFELIGGVSFKKGCYPGQEIVARMHYRGGLKRRMALRDTSTGTEAPQARRRALQHRVRRAGRRTGRQRRARARGRLRRARGRAAGEPRHAGTCAGNRPTAPLELASFPDAEPALTIVPRQAS